MSLGVGGCSRASDALGEDVRAVRMVMWGSPAMDALEALATEYNLQHPGVRIIMELQPADAYEMWMTIQMVSSAPPAILQSQWYWSWEYARKGKVRRLDDYLDRVNPYTGRVWRDQFYAGRLDSVRDPRGELYIVPHDQVKTALYYNANIFDDVGVSPPSTWAEFDEISRKIRAAGYVPVGVDNSQAAGIVEWNVSVFFDSIYRDEIPLLDVLNEDGFVEKQEAVRGYAVGVFDPLDDQYKEIWRIFKDWSRHWEAGFNAVDATDLSRLFLQSRVSMRMDGSWHGQFLKPDIADLPEDEQFEFSMFPLPNLTAETSRYAHVPLGSVGSVGAGYVIPTLIPDETAEAAVDWLMWLIRPDNMGLMYENTGVRLEFDGEKVMLDIGEEVGLTLADELRRFEANNQRPYATALLPGVAGPAFPVDVSGDAGEPTTTSAYADVGYRPADSTFHVILGPPGTGYGDAVELPEPLCIVGRAHGDPESLRGLPDATALSVEFYNAPLNLPCMEGVRLRREHQGFVPLMDGTFPDLRILEGSVWPDRECQTAWFRSFQEFMADDIDLDEFSDRIAGFVQAGVKREIARWGYDTSKW